MEDLNELVPEVENNEPTLEEIETYENLRK